MPLDEAMHMRVYKFLSASNALDDLEKRRIKISTIDELNDPFDLTALDTTDPGVEIAVGELVKWFRKTKGMLCFSRNWDNILLWSHYGDCHTGICLGFDIPDAQADGGYYLHVSYQPNLLVAQRPGDVNQDFSGRLLSTKYEGWSYEREVRLFVALNDPPDNNGMSWFDFGSGLDLKEVIVGAQCSQEDAKKVIGIRARYAATIDFSWACLRKDAFSLVRTPTPPQWLIRGS
jgi:Protein of unknown function (DUF2971)